MSARYFRTPVPVDVKSDASPVTQADREAEAAVRALLSVKVRWYSLFLPGVGLFVGFSKGRASNKAAAWALPCE